jgi:quinol monooxygenase YgiN
MTCLPQQVAQLVQALRSLMRSARAEKGFLTSRICFEADNSNTVCYEERWTTLEDFEAEMQSSRFANLLALMESASEQPSLEFHFVSETRGLEYVAAVRRQERRF